MDFQQCMQPTREEYFYREPGYFVWCGSIFRYQNTYYLAYSRWKKELGFEAWVTSSEICLAKADSLWGQFCYVRTLFPKDATLWYGSCTHNPTVLSWKGKFYLYFMGNVGNGDWWTHRNHQRIGVAYAKDPEGEWTVLPTPVVDITPHSVDELMTSNPSVTVMPNGGVRMLYKAVSAQNPLPAGGPVVCAGAVADNPLGPFRKEGRPLFLNPQEPWSVEDPFLWYMDGRYFALVKDFHGYFTGTGKNSVGLFTSENGKDWRPAEHPLAYEPVLPFADHRQPVYLLERPQLYIENGVPLALVTACMPDASRTDTYSVRIPLRFF